MFKPKYPLKNPFQKYMYDLPFFIQMLNLFHSYGSLPPPDPIRRLSLRILCHFYMFAGPDNNSGPFPTANAYTASSAIIPIL